MNRKSKIIVSVVGITIVLLALLGITYAYYLTRIEGNTNTNSISATTADLRLVYGDGNGIITKNDIMPGTTIGEKTFTVKNTGKTKIDDYAVTLEYAYLEDVIPSIFERPNDFEITLTCSSTKEDGTTGTCNGFTSKFNNENIIMTTNAIESEEIHNYSLTIYYANPNEDQSNDMGKNLNLIVNIARLSETADINGEITGVDNTYSVRLNSEPKVSSIIKNSDNKYVYNFRGVPLGVHTLTVLNKDGEQVSSHKLVIESGAEAKTGTKEITYEENGENVTTTVPSITIKNEKRVANITTNVINSTVSTTGNTMDSFNPYAGNKSSLAYNIINNAMLELNGTEFSVNPKTILAEETSTKYVMDELGSYKSESIYGKYFIYSDEIMVGQLSMKLINPKIFENKGDLRPLRGKYIYEKTPFQSLPNISNGKYSGFLYHVGENTTETTLYYTHVSRVKGEAERTLAVLDDVYGSTYYYRGDVQDNYVLFNNMCFRIVRILGDGSVKLIYAGDVSDGATNCNEVGEQTGIIKDENNEIITATYGWKEEDSLLLSDYQNNIGGKANDQVGLEETLKNWFNSKFTSDDNKNKIKTDKWCLGGNENFKYDLNGELIDDISKHVVWDYAADKRLSEYKVSLKCENEDFIESKYGALTSDEIVLSGSARQLNAVSNVENYLAENANTNYWTISRGYISIYDDIEEECVNFGIHVNSYGAVVSGDCFEFQYAARPAITLVSGISIFSGDGTKGNPYVIN